MSRIAHYRSPQIPKDSVPCEAAHKPHWNVSRLFLGDPMSFSDLELCLEYARCFYVVLQLLAYKWLFTEGTSLCIKAMCSCIKIAKQLPTLSSGKPKTNKIGQIFDLFSNVGTFANEWDFIIKP